MIDMTARCCCQNAADVAKVIRTGQQFTPDIYGDCNFAENTLISTLTQATIGADVNPVLIGVIVDSDTESNNLYFKPCSPSDVTNGDDNPLVSTYYFGFGYRVYLNFVGASVASNLSIGALSNRYANRGINLWSYR